MRPTKYKEEYNDQLYNYFDIPSTIPEIIRAKNEDGDWQDEETGKYIANKLPTVVGFCRLIKIHRDTFYEWVDKHPAFSDTYKKCQMITEDMWNENSMFGRYATAYTIFYGKNIFGWKDKQEVQIEHKDTAKLKSLVEQYE